MTSNPGTTKTIPTPIYGDDETRVACKKMVNDTPTPTTAFNERDISARVKEARKYVYTISPNLSIIDGAWINNRLTDIIEDPIKLQKILNGIKTDRTFKIYYEEFARIFDNT
ncbi:MAG: hypothetical protein UR28_C0031G0001 [Candidatus Peregrinibacteria bacterium GW2011_GWF2_33_10]|nr:MAG: hypothetical protein UR28_C0031G0001 [Candidatus Peregrinibacteria bacterium GW2011_GWF2_33_10]OGJ44646.1 MAG: hypothetical protein A2263_00185 [Candidatus Peregrinibacteria bacterium RIFOXYA2_FULL_33_21]OGJ46408.1 MAG: hypothetical protein A2272_06560 [Candidatus Peregrinibacteria bacterium RIFOXYA12_FULL_33_12]